MTLPRAASLVLAALAAAFCAAAYGLRFALPPERAVTNARLAALRVEGAQLAAFSDDAAQAGEGKLGELRRKFWTPEAFAVWRRNNVPEGWIVQSLGPADLAHVHALRYAFERPNAADKDWSEIAAVLGGLEKAPCVSVQSAALAVQPGYAESRHFSQCLLIAVFYFAGDATANPAG